MYTDVPLTIKNQILNQKKHSESFSHLNKSKGNANGKRQMLPLGGKDRSERGDGDGCEAEEIWLAGATDSLPGGQPGVQASLGATEPGADTQAASGGGNRAAEIGNLPGKEGGGAEAVLVQEPGKEKRGG